MPCASGLDVELPKVRVHLDLFHGGDDRSCTDLDSIVHALELELKEIYAAAA